MIEMMVDIETLGKEADAVVVSIGACMFNPITGEISDRKFDRVIDIQDSLDHGLKVEGGALKWWMTGSAEARAAFLNNDVPVTLKEALNSLTKYAASFNHPDLIHVWANDPSFDTAKLQYNYHKAGLEYPFKHWNNTCVRTILRFYPKSLFKEWKLNNPRKGYHQASADAEYQARYVSHILMELGCEELY